MSWYFCPSCRHSLHHEDDVVYCNNCGFIKTPSAKIHLHVRIISEEDDWPHGELMAGETLLKAARRLCAKAGISITKAGTIQAELVEDGVLHLMYEINSAKTNNPLQQKLLDQSSNH